MPSGDGMHRLNGELDSETAALAMTVLHSLAAPKPTEAGERDERTAGQRLHDAFRSVLKLALRAGELPTSGGVPATVLITMTAEQFQTGTGLAATSYGQLLHIDQALRLADQAASPGSCTTAAAASSTTAPPAGSPPTNKPSP